ncbi:MAG: hypothetical protein JWN25_3179 [Verrucomicrobiales bacterium]|nr:hypothetical protein [Verrucomicrobiales bacterium]
MLPIQRILVNQIKANWAGNFPFLKPVDLRETPNRPRGTNYICDDYLQTRRVVYFVSLELVPKNKEDITLEITISDSPEKSRRAVGWKSGIDVQKIATYRIGSFFSNRDYWWRLADTEGNLIKLFSPSYGSGSSDVNIWGPSSFDKPSDIIVNEAIANINDKLVNHVFTALGIEASI